MTHIRFNGSLASFLKSYDVHCAGINKGDILASKTTADIITDDDSGRFDYSWLLNKALNYIELDDL